jgi:hypothetical protein
MTDSNKGKYPVCVRRCQLRVPDTCLKNDLGQCKHFKGGFSPL